MALTKISGGVLQQPINISGNVGIGSTQPTEALDVNGNISIVPNSGSRGIYIGNGTRDGIGQLISDQNRSNADKNILSVQGRWANTQVASIFFQTGSDTVNKNEGYIEFKTRNGESGAIPTRMTLSKEGNLGIGLTNPSAILEVATSVDGEATLATFKNISGGGTNETVDIKLGLENVVASNVILRAGKEANHSSGAATDNFFAIHTTLDNTSSEKLRIKSNGNVGIGTENPQAKLHVSGGNIKVDDGFGIDFSATTDATGMTSELLDDYEEGTWTPTVVNGTGTFDTTGDTAAWCHYTKIGKRVWLDGYCRIATMDDTSNTFEIGGVPFTPMDPGAGGFTGSVMAHSITWADGTSTQLVSYITDTTGGVRLYGCQNNASWDVVQNVDLNADDSFYFNVSYLVA